MEQNRQDWAPVHLAKCFGELALMYVQEVLRAVDDNIQELPDYGTETT